LTAAAAGGNGGGRGGGAFLPAVAAAVAVVLGGGGGEPVEDTDVGGGGAGGFPCVEAGDVLGGCVAAAVGDLADARMASNAMRLLLLTLVVADVVTVEAITKGLRRPTFTSFFPLNLIPTK